MRDNAVAAAFRDPRFLPLQRAEFGDIRVEVSLLSPTEVMAVKDEAAALAALRPHVDGVVPRIWAPPQRLPAAGVGAVARTGRIPGAPEAQGRLVDELLGRGCAPVALHRRQVEGGRRMSLPESQYPARWWHALPDGRIQCDLCPRDCQLHEGQRGLCFVRKREGGRMVLTTYGRSSGFCVDPIEKKPLNHFLPGIVGALLRHRRLQPGLQVLPELGHLQVARDRHAGRSRPRPTRSPPPPRQERLRERGLHLQRPGDLRRVRDGRGRRLPRRSASRPWR